MQTAESDIINDVQKWQQENNLEETTHGITEEEYKSYH